ncbi:hypothetical protein J2T13_001429 [Paenibacillus sp. DS2015]|uniref:hypothetical protein n=1 Tax=Paenibacillus sp. DS2015 TaxID=3373917 RepID=UPI003D222EB4
MKQKTFILVVALFIGISVYVSPLSPVQAASPTIEVLVDYETAKPVAELIGVIKHNPAVELWHSSGGYWSYNNLIIKDSQLENRLSDADKLAEAMDKGLNKDPNKEPTNIIHSEIPLNSTLYTKLMKANKVQVYVSSTMNGKKLSELFYEKPTVTLKDNKVYFEGKPKFHFYNEDKMTYKTFVGDELGVTIPIVHPDFGYNRYSIWGRSSSVGWGATNGFFDKGKPYAPAPSGSGKIAPSQIMNVQGYLKNGFTVIAKNNKAVTSTLNSGTVSVGDGTFNGGGAVAIHFEYPIMLSFYTDETEDLSAEFESFPPSSPEGSSVEIDVRVESTFGSIQKDVPYQWAITTKSGDPVPVTFSGHIKNESKGKIASIPAKGERLLTATFIMPNEGVNITFEINKGGKAPIEEKLDNNVLQSTVTLSTPISLPYDLLSKQVRLELPSNTVKLTLPSLPDAQWTGNAKGGLQVSNGTDDLQREFVVLNNPAVNENSVTITRTPVATFTIKREDFGDDPLNEKWKNLSDPGEPLERMGEIHNSGSVSRPYQYTYSWQTCSRVEEEVVCTTHSETRNGTVTSEFKSDTVQKPYQMYVYNGRKEIPEHTYQNVIEDDALDSRKKELYWTNEPYLYSVIRWMHHQNVSGVKYNWTQVPGQYERSFIQQASGTVGWTVGSSMQNEYSQAREAARSKLNKKALYDKAVFATDQQLQSYDYPIKSGYYFNPRGSYNLTVKTVVFKPTDGETEDHQDMVNAVINSFRYETDLMYINSNKQAVNIRNKPLHPIGGGFERETGILSVKNSESVNRVKLISVLDKNTDESRYTKEVNEIPYTDARGGSSHKFWKQVLEGYSESYTEGSNTYYNYREYVKAGQHMYKITETTQVTIVVNPTNIPLYTHANMPNGTYGIKVWLDDTVLSKGNHAYKVLDKLEGIEALNAIPITVVGSMYDDLNN